MIRNLIVLPDGSEVFSGAAGAAILDCALTRTVSSGEELTVGAVCSAMLEFTLIHPGAAALAAGQEVTLYHVSEDGSRQQAGIFTMEKPVRSGAERCKVTAYDRISRLDKDLTQWLKNRENSCSLLEFARQVCAACGVTLATKSIPNASLPVPVFSAGEVTGRLLMKWVGEASGRFCRATPQGTVELGWYTPSGIALGPGATEAAEITEDGGTVTVTSRSVKTVDDNRGGVTLLSPVLSMEDGVDTGATLSGLEQAARIPWFSGSLELADYHVAPVEAVQLQLSGVLWPTVAEGANTYIIAGNPILSRADEDISTALKNILAQLSAVGGYTPCRVSIPATADIQPGTTVTLTDAAGNTHTLPVMSVTRSGQKDTLECTGEQRRDSSAAKNNRSAEQIAQQKVDALSQSDIFNKLTDGGKLQGLYIQDGKLYINAEFVKIINLIAERIWSSSALEKTVKIDDGNIRFTEVIDGKEVHVGSIFSLNEILEVYSPKMLRIGADVRTQVGNIGAPTGIYGSKVMLGTEGTTVTILGKSISWKDNGDGTFTLIGT